jgi:hypothetical protein
MDLPSKSSQLIESKEYCKAAKELYSSFKIRDDIHDLFLRDFSGDLSACQQVPGTSLYAIPLRTVSPLTLYFTMNGNIIELIDVEPI